MVKCCSNCGKELDENVRFCRSCGFDSMNKSDQQQSGDRITPHKKKIEGIATILSFLIP